MSSQDPFRSRQSKPSREMGDAPGIGRVSKFRTGSGGRPSKVTAVDSIDRKLNMVSGLGVFLLLCGLIVVALAAWVFISSRKNQEAAKKIENLQMPAVVTENAPTRDTVAIPSAIELEAIVDKFLKARSEEEAASLIRKSDQTMPVILEKLAGLEAKDGKLQSLKTLDNVSSQALRQQSVLVTFEGGRNRLAILSPDEAGQWRVDFDGFDRYLSKPIDEILSGKDLDARVRFYVSADSYYNGRFKDDSQWACYGMASPDSDQLMFGYVAVGSPQHKALRSLIVSKAEARNTKTTRSRLLRMMLDIRHHADGEARQFEILRVLSDEWALGPTPLDELLDAPAVR